MDRFTITSFEHSEPKRREPRRWWVLDRINQDLDTGFIGEPVGSPAGYENRDEARRVWARAIVEHLVSLAKPGKLAPFYGFLLRDDEGSGP